VQRAPEKTRQITDPLESWMWRLEHVLSLAPARLTGRVHTDYDRVEVARNGKLRAVEKLISVTARVGLTFTLPPLPRGIQLAPRGDEFLLVGPGPNQEELLSHLLQDALDPPTVRLIILPVLISRGESFLETDDWFALSKDWSVGRIRCCVEAMGVLCKIDLHLEAS
jgi:hypothetical protein